VAAVEAGLARVKSANPGRSPGRDEEDEEAQHEEESGHGSNLAVVAILPLVAGLPLFTRFLPLLMMASLPSLNGPRPAQFPTSRS
jgi:hypothetical protein